MKYIVAVDGPDPDNVVAVLLACKAFGAENVAVILTGRKLQNGTQEEERYILVLNTARFYSWLARYGFESVQIYDGGIAAHTIIPDTKHFDERNFEDIDSRVAQKPLRHLRELPDRLDSQFTVIVGGPMTGVRDLLRIDPGLAQRINAMYAMYGPPSKEGMFPKNFNVLCDEPAGVIVLEQLVKAGVKVAFAPTDATKHKDIKVRPEDLNNIFSDSKLMDIYQKWYDAALGPRGEDIYIHDVAPVMMAIHAEGKVRVPVFKTESVDPSNSEALGLALNLRTGGSRIEGWPESQGGFSVELATTPDPNVYFGVLRTAFQAN